VLYHDKQKQERAALQKPRIALFPCLLAGLFQVAGMKRDTDFENVTNFYDFYKAFLPWSLRIVHFFKLADNEYLSCTKVVGANARKWGHFEVFGEWLVRCDRLVGLVKEGTEEKAIMC